jgi:serine protease Do
MLGKKLSVELFMEKSMLKRKNAGGWVLALVAVILFGGLILRGLSDRETAAPEEPMAAGMVMSGNERAFARDLSAAFESITAQYLPVAVAIQANTAGRAESCGLLVSSDGYILTNSQNFLNGDSVRVVLHKGRRFSGSVVGGDPLTDLALIKIAAKGLPYAKFGDSDRLRVGQWVMAIGNTGQPAPAVTAAIINARGRSKISLPQMEDFIHTDMTMPRASQGGALVSLEGELIGVNTTMQSHNGGALAIPANLVKRVMLSLMKEGKFTRGYIGATAQNLDQHLARALQLNSTLGALLVEVAANSPAERAGLRRGDVVLHFAGIPISSANDFENAVAGQKPEKNVQMAFWRDTAKVVCEIMPEERPPAHRHELAMASRRHKPANKLGLQVQNLSPEMIRMHLVPGVVISQIDPGAAAAQVLAVGDIIQEMNHRAIRSVRDFNGALPGLQTGEVALLLVRRGEKNFFSGVEVQE